MSMFIEVFCPFPILNTHGLHAHNIQANLMKNLSSVPEAHQRLSSRLLLPLTVQLWERDVGGATSRFACHVLANLSRSDVPGVRNRLFRVRIVSS